MEANKQQIIWLLENVTQYRIAKETGMSQGSLSQLKKGKELDTFIIDADNIEEAKTTAENLAHADGVWSYDLEIKVSEDF